MRIRVQPAVLNGKAVSVRRMAAEYLTLYTGLYRDVGLVSSAWKGIDSDAFLRRAEGFKPDLDEMVKLLNQYADFLEESATKYEEAQDRVANKASRLRV